MILIGSRAFRVHGIELPRPENYKSDIDLIMNESEFNLLISSKRNIKWAGIGSNKVIANDGKNKFEIELTPSVKSREYLNYIKDSVHGMFSKIYISELDGIPIYVPCLFILFLMKKSHITYPVHWFKNIEDYHYLKNLPEIAKKLEKTTIQDHIIYGGLYDQLLEEIDARFKNKVNLNVKNDEFFGQYDIDRKIDHDKLHEIVAYYPDGPMYKKLKKDQDKALCNKELWDQCTLEQQLNAVREEAYVISLERIIIPKLFKGQFKDNSIYHMREYHKAYKWALMRICTTLTKGWFREFAIENWPTLKNPVIVSGHNYRVFVEKIQKSL